MDILSYTFMQRAFLAGLIVALMCPLIGMFIVIKRQSMLGDGLGHIAFAGVTGASLLKVYPPLGAVVLTVLSAMGIELVRRYQKQYADMIMALFFYAGLALAIVFSTLVKMPSTGLLNFLFGSILTVAIPHVSLKPRFHRCADATGTIIRALINRMPTTVIPMTTTKAVRTAKIIFTRFTLMPTVRAISSSKDVSIKE